MNMMGFAQEFSNLVIRYTKEPLPNASSDNLQPVNIALTKKEVMNVVNSVLATLLGKDYVNINNDISKTSITEIVTPTTTPTGVKITNQSEDDGNIYRDSRSWNIQETPKNSGISDFNLKSSETEKNTTLEVFQDGKKFISRSSPAICVNNVGRSDTFVLNENQLAKVAANLKTFNDPFAKVEITSAAQRSLNEIRMSAMNIVRKLDEIKNQTFSQSLSGRRLSTNDINSGQVSNMTKLSISATTIPAKMRRSISDFPPGTPISSTPRSLATGSQDTVDKRKNLGAASADTKSRKSDSTTVTRSISNLNLSSSNKSLDSVNKITKTSKYAHIQSTIPKPTLSKRKI